MGHGRKQQDRCVESYKEQEDGEGEKEIGDQEAEDYESG